jgi:homoserine kinase
VEGALNIFDKAKIEKADADYDHMRAWADIENSCFDHATKLEIELKKFLKRNSLPVEIMRAENVLTLARANGLTLAITSKDHAMYEVERWGEPDIMADHHRIYGYPRLSEAKMTREVIEWLQEL